MVTVAERVQAFHGSLCREHVEEGAFRWQVREHAIRNGHASFKQLADMDAALDSHIDGVRVAGERLWAACDSLTTPEDPGEMFVSGILALEGQRRELLDRLLVLSEQAEPWHYGLQAAFGWTSARYLTGTVKSLLSSGLPTPQALGVASCAMHGVDAGAYLTQSVTADDARLTVTAIRAVGQLGRTDLMTACYMHFTHSDPSVQRAAAVSAILLGDRGDGLRLLGNLCRLPDAIDESWFAIRLQAMELNQAHALLQELSAESVLGRRLIVGSGIAGDPAYVRWLHGLMTDRGTARVAGEAFSLITGADIERLHLDSKAPVEGTSSDGDADDLKIDRDPDDGLPWPDPEKIEQWWTKNASRFQSGTRYFIGEPVTREHCIDVLKNGYQRQRILAAQYLCLMEPGRPLFNTSAPASRQQRLLARM